MCKQCMDLEFELIPELEMEFLKTNFNNSLNELEFELIPELIQESRTSRDYIKWVQNSLNKLLRLNLIEDGIAGVKTRAAVRSFQQQNGLTADGIVGPITERYIQTAVAKNQTQPASQPLTGVNWASIQTDQRILYVVERLVNQYSFPVNGACGVVGNLYEESAVLPNRIEGSSPATPMKAPNFQGQMQTFTASEIMNRSYKNKRGPKSPGIGLAQWTSATRRQGLFLHSYQNKTLGANILFDMDAQIDYLVAELKSAYSRTNRILRNPSVSVNDASDEVIYDFERPGSIFDANKQRLPKSHSRVQTVFQRRRNSSQRAWKIYRAAHP